MLSGLLRVSRLRSHQHSPPQGGTNARTPSHQRRKAQLREGTSLAGDGGPWVSAQDFGLPSLRFRGKAPVPRSGKLTGTQSRFSPQKVLLGDQIRGPVRTTPGTSWQGATRTAPSPPHPAARSPQPEEARSRR